MKLAAFAILTLTFLSAGSVSWAADLKPMLGKTGAVLLDEKFEAAEAPKGWAVNTGTLRVVEGRLMAAEKASDKHIGAFRYRLPLQDCAVQVEFQLGEARIFNLGFDPAPGELKKKGHLLSVIVTKGLWSLVEHNDKADPASKTKVLAKAATVFEPGTRYTLLLEVKGNDVVVQATGKEPLRATSADFHVKKPGLVFRMGGTDPTSPSELRGTDPTSPSGLRGTDPTSPSGLRGTRGLEVAFDNVKVWAVE